MISCFVYLVRTRYISLCSDQANIYTNDTYVNMSIVFLTPCYWYYACKSLFDRILILKNNARLIEQVKPTLYHYPIARREPTISWLHHV